PKPSSEEAIASEAPWGDRSAARPACAHEAWPFRDRRVTGNSIAEARRGNPGDAAFDRGAFSSAARCNGIDARVVLHFIGGVGIPGARHRPWHPRAVWAPLTGVAVVWLAGTAA